MISSSVFPNCCGLSLLHGEQYYATAETYFKDFAQAYYVQKKMPTISLVGGLMFEHSAQKDIGKKITEYVEKHGLGTVHCCPPVPNPVHGGRPLLIYLWVHNRTELMKHLQELVKPPAPPAVPAPVAQPPLPEPLVLEEPNEMFKPVKEPRNRKAP